MGSEMCIRDRPWAAQLSSISSLEAVDKYTVRMNLKESFAPILRVISTAWYTEIVPYDVTPENNLNDKASGTGPFMLVEYVPDDHVSLKANPDYLVHLVCYSSRVRRQATYDV